MDVETPAGDEAQNTGNNNTKPSKRGAPSGSSSGQRQPRKRTKTGCLTCRKRRIKCGEERPTCLNCQRSRRECEGYRPPIVFRRSHLYSGQPDVSLAPHSELAGPYFGSFAPPFTAPLEQEGAVGWSSVAPEWQSIPGLDRSSGFGPAPPHALHEPVTGFGSQLPFTAFTHVEYEQAPALHFDNGPWSLQDGLGVGRDLDPPSGRSSLDQFPGIASISPDETLSLFHESASDPSLYGQEPYRPVIPNDYEIPIASSTDHYPASLEASSARFLHSLHPLSQNRYGSEFTSGPAMHTADATGVSQIQSSSYPSVGESFPRAGWVDHQLRAALHNRRVHGVTFGHPGVSQFLDAAAVNVQDDDYWDVQSDAEDDESVEDNRAEFDPGSIDREYRTITALTTSSISLAISNLTNANTYTYPGFFVDSYRPEYTANPLRNPYTQRVFAHFVFSTGPLISYLQQRNRISLSTSSSPQSIASSHQGLWTYSLAVMALHNQGLLHAMLAMASLHMAKLQGASITPSLKHYSYSLRRVHRDVQHNRKRHEVPTLAATLLLAFYEVMQADHRKWCTHLVGAKQLVSEIDFAEMSARVEHEKAKTATEAAIGDRIELGEKRAGSTAGGASSRNEKTYPIQELFPDIDASLVSKLMGKPPPREEKRSWPASGDGEGMSTSELRNFQLLQDLFWWNCRHDIVHGLVGGDALLLNYDSWGVCQPRAPAGRADAVHGSFDHFMLLLGNLVRFIAQDRPRKIKAAKTAKAAMVGQGQAGVQPPPFYGMAPSAGPADMPRAFQRPMQPSAAPAADTRSNGNDNDDPAAAIHLESATAAAVAEWEDIIAAFNALADAFGPDFQPLADDEGEPLHTPFGPAVIFKSHGIAALWAWYYAGLIIAMRAHPSMPAPATLAIGAAFQKTAQYANQVGRIVYCISSDFLSLPLDPSSAGAFAEASLPLFFAGVQYMDPEQRRWTISRLREIETLTGWSTIGLCASGCEGAWTKMHELGRGPEYTRSTGIKRGDQSRGMFTAAAEHGISGATNTVPSHPYPSMPAAGPSTPTNNAKSRHVDAAAAAKVNAAGSRDAERRYAPFYRGSEVMWAYQLYNTSLEDDMAGMALGPEGDAPEAP